VNIIGLVLLTSSNIDSLFVTYFINYLKEKLTS